MSTTKNTKHPPQSMVCIGLGDFGVKSVSAICRELIVDRNLSDGIEFQDYLFYEANNDSFFNCFLIDNKSDFLSNTLPKQKYNENINPDNVINLDEKFSDLFNVFYESGDVIDELILKINTHISTNCKDFEGFYFFHDLATGIGSGLSLALISRLREEFPDRVFWCFNLVITDYENCKSNAIINTVCAFHQFIEYSDLNILIDNSKLLKYAYSFDFGGILEGLEPSYLVLSKIFSDFTSASRFHSKGISSTKQMCLNFIPFPRLHFKNLYFSHNTDQIKTLNNFYKTENNLLLDEQDEEKMTQLMTHVFLRGNFDEVVVEENLVKITEDQDKYYKSGFAKNIAPPKISYSLCSSVRDNNYFSAIQLADNSINVNYFKNLSEIWNKMDIGSKLAPYTEKGMDVMEFEEAKANVDDLIMEYEQYIDECGNDSDSE